MFEHEKFRLIKTEELKGNYFETNEDLFSNES